MDVDHLSPMLPYALLALMGLVAILFPVLALSLVVPWVTGWQVENFPPAIEFYARLLIRSAFWFIAAALWLDVSLALLQGDVLF